MHMHFAQLSPHQFLEDVMLCMRRVSMRVCQFNEASTGYTLLCVASTG
jgi:hypothetical protein